MLVQYSSWLSAQADGWAHTSTVIKSDTSCTLDTQNTSAEQKSTTGFWFIGTGNMAEYHSNGMYHITIFVLLIELGNGSKWPCFVRFSGCKPCPQPDPLVPLVVTSSSVSCCQGCLLLYIYSLTLLLHVFFSLSSSAVNGVSGLAVM